MNLLYFTLDQSGICRGLRRDHYHITIVFIFVVFCSDINGRRLWFWHGDSAILVAKLTRVLRTQNNVRIWWWERVVSLSSCSYTVQWNKKVFFCCHLEQLCLVVFRQRRSNFRHETPPMSCMYYYLYDIHSCLSFRVHGIRLHFPQLKTYLFV